MVRYSSCECSRNKLITILDLTNMKIELTLNIKDAIKSRDFYSAVGVEWLRGEGEFEIFEEYEDGNMGLPDLVGKIDHSEISFYIDKNVSRNKTISPMIVLHPSSLEEFNLIISRLKDISMYSNCSHENSLYDEILLDPDGHCIALCPINPFAQFQQELNPTSQL
jgi:predicted lactoylglutathione lyase